MLLRNFLYLNTASVDVYLSTLEGFIIEGPIEHTQATKGTRGGSVGIDKLFRAEGSAGSESSSETKQRQAITPTARFQRLYELLDEQDSIQPLGAFDPEIMDQLRRGEVFEVEAEITIPEIFVASEAASELGTLISSFSKVAEVFSPELSNPLAAMEPAQIQAMQEFGVLLSKEPIPVHFTAESTRKFHFGGILSREHLSVGPVELQGEAVVFGKVQRIIPKGQTYDIPILSPSLVALAQTRNRAERRRTKGQKPQWSPVQKIKGPGVIVEVIAIYR
ncbi:MAG TPA: hypothetical protein VLA19_29800 [Herpetosiphonaceae bacterium]|nr:hypothetical protein [Herpetosiphonaceae bacterium]